MFGRNSQNAYSTGTYSTGSYGSGNYGSTQNYSSYRQNNQSNNPRVGSYRVRDYDPQKLYEVLAKVQQFKDFIPTSIALREETMHLSPIELRTEDYYLLRTKAVDDKHRRMLESCIDKKIFNRELMSQDSMITLGEMLSFTETPLSADNIEKLCNGNMSRYGNTSSSPFGNYSSGNSTMGSSNNMFSRTGTSNNMFSNNSSNNNSNPFASNNMNSSSYNTRSSTGANPFASNNSSSSTGNNMFSSRTNNMMSSNSNRNMFSNSSGNNMFANTNNSSNPFSNTNNSNNTSNNMFNNNSSNNMFSSNRFSNNNNSNPFANNSSGGGSSMSNNLFNNNSNSGNPFANNNSNNSGASNNMFNNSRNLFNNNNSGGNNLFNNGSGGNNLFNRGNNLFNNNNNNSGGGNNLFNNNSNNNSNMGMMNAFNEYAMLQMAHLLKECADKVFSSPTPSSTTPTTGTGGAMNSFASLYQDPNNNYSEYVKNSERLEKRYAEWFTNPFEEDTGYGYTHARKKSKFGDNAKTIVIVKEGSNVVGNSGGSFIKNGMGTTNKFDTIWEGEPRNDSISASQYNRFYTDKPTPSQTPKAPFEPTQQNSAIKKTSSSFKVDFRQAPSNYNTVKSFHRDQDSIYGSNMKSKMGTNNEMNGIRYRYRVCCIWGEDLRRSKGPDSEREEFYAEGDLLLNCSPSLMELTQLILADIQNKAGESSLIIRKDANLTLQLPHALSRQEYQIKGTLVQNKINLGKGYDYIYDNLEGWEVTNLTIVNKLGRVLWPGVVDIREVDFEKHVSIICNQVNIDGPLEWNYDKVVTLNSLPASVENELPDERKARLEMERVIKRSRKKTKNEGIQLMELDLKNKFYTVKIGKCPEPSPSP